MGHGSSLGKRETDKRSSLSHVKGYGASGNGVSEWLTSRLNAIISVPASLYVLCALLKGNANSYLELSHWLLNPFNTAILVLAIIALCWHGALGVVTVIDDYIHNTGMNFFIKLLVRVFFSFIVIISVISILFVIFAGLAKGVM